MGRPRHNSIFIRRCASWSVLIQRRLLPPRWDKFGPRHGLGCRFVHRISGRLLTCDPSSQRRRGTAWNHLPAFPIDFIPGSPHWTNLMSPQSPEGTFPAIWARRLDRSCCLSPKPLGKLFLPQYRKKTRAAGPIPRNANLFRLLVESLSAGPLHL